MRLKRVLKRITKTTKISSVGALRSILLRSDRPATLIAAIDRRDQPLAKV